MSTMSTSVILCHALRQMGGKKQPGVKTEQTIQFGQSF